MAHSTEGGVSVFYHQIETAEQDLEQLKRSYLKSFGWTETCSTPGSYWLWARDCSDLDAPRLEFHAKHPDTSPPALYGRVTAPTDLAVSMTVRCLDEQREIDDDEATSC